MTAEKVVDLRTQNRFKYQAPNVRSPLFGGVLAVGLLATVLFASARNETGRSSSDLSVSVAASDIDPNLNADLVSFLEASYSGEAVGPNGQTLSAAFFDENRINPRIRNISNPQGRIAFLEGSKARWYPAIDKIYPDASEDATTLPKSEWKAYCDKVGPSARIVTTDQLKADGTYFVIDWIEEITPLGRRFFAMANTQNGKTEELITYDSKQSEVCDAVSGGK